MRSLLRFKLRKPFLFFHGKQLCFSFRAPTVSTNTSCFGNDPVTRYNNGNRIGRACTRNCSARFHPDVWLHLPAIIGRSRALCCNIRDNYLIWIGKKYKIEPERNFKLVEGSGSFSFIRFMGHQIFNRVQARGGLVFCLDISCFKPCTLIPRFMSLPKPSPLIFSKKILFTLCPMRLSSKYQVRNLSKCILFLNTPKRTWKTLLFR